MASLVSDPCFFLHRPLIPERKAGSDWNSRCLGFPLTCQRSEHYKRHQRVKFQVEVKASSGGNVLVDEMASAPPVKHDFGVVDIHHVGVLCENLEKSLEFYQNLLGLEINEARPHHKLPYRGAWLWVGSGMIHLMELPNPDPLSGRPEHGGRDRHACISIHDVSKLKAIFDDAGIKYTLSKSGRPAIFARDPDGNALEFTQIDEVQIVKAERDDYGAIIVEKIAMKIGPGHYQPPSGPQKWSIATEGRDYKAWEIS